MLRLASYDIVFQEIPDHVTLALNLSDCPNRCAGCHSPHLQDDVGEPMDERMISGLLARYGDAITCICFMGGDAATDEVQRLAALVRGASGGRIRTAWYSGRQHLPNDFGVEHFDFIKLGPYVERLGGLDSPTTNQRLYRVEADGLRDITASYFLKMK